MSDVNGINGHKAGTSGFQWKVGLQNSLGKYLTAETFGFKINASGVGLKKKQVWTIEQVSNEEWVYLRSHLGRYLSADRHRNVTCEAEEPTESERFAVEYSKNGRWAFKNVAHQYYLGGNDDKVTCFDKPPNDIGWWSIQLSIHPQVHLRNVNRKRYAHLANDELQCTEIVPWGADSLVIMDFVDGRYTLKSCDNRYLSREGTLQETMTEDTMFTLEIRSGALAFKDHEGRYLTSVGAQAVMKARNKMITKDELFTIEDSHPQVMFVAHNGKKVSVKQGVDVSANQDEDVSDKEIFQLEYDSVLNKWAVRTDGNKYWTLHPSTGIQATATDVKPGGQSKDECFFELVWQENGLAAIKASNGMYIYNKPSGTLMGGSEAVTDKEKFQVVLLNRPLVVLKGEHGFVGVKGNQYICNKTSYDIIKVESNKKGGYLLKGQNGKYWEVNADSTISAEGNSASDFIFEFHGQSKVAIKASHGAYLMGYQNGDFKAVADTVDCKSLWEY
ncbi:hypothetical protein ACJMK2_034284 [Sinanodonta woodiana]|uniref:Fascin n=2 Tax=Sinanodonta woodiana TaxID=1069815 RepID=A0ABD3WR34_SINWO